MKRVVVVSGKGGTGKTSLTASLAALARSRAVLVDADVDAPNLALVADAEQIAFQSFTGGEKALIHPEKCQRCLTCVHACRFGAISDHLDYPQVNSVRCEGCKLCARLCLVGAITMEPHVSGFLFTSRTRRNSRLYH
ncbi:MAG: 4Fe-4S binding protein, partial [Candidatus Caldatribacteriaceae bacterium]